MKVQTSHNEIPGCVLEGVKLLDLKRPGWRSMVNPETLDMMTNHGLLEQIFRSQEAAMKELGISRDELGKYGFFPEQLRGGSALTIAWKQVIKTEAPVLAPVAPGTIDPDEEILASPA